jgi:hypothetical protein
MIYNFFFEQDENQRVQRAASEAHSQQIAEQSWQIAQQSGQIALQSEAMSRQFAQQNEAMNLQIAFLRAELGKINQ